MDKIITVLGYEKIITEMSDAPDWAPTSLKFNAELANLWNLNAKFRFLFVI